MDQRHYRRAPITEAIIDLKVKARDGWTLPMVEKVRVGEEAAYPGTRQTAIAQELVEVGERVAASATQQQTGFAFVSADQKQVFQARLDGFTFNRLAPYESWEPFRNEAQRLWAVYRERLEPAAVTRLAVRYINRFDLPGATVEMKEYFRTAPEISPDLPQVMNGFFMRVQIPQDDLGGQLLINQTIIPPARPGVVSVALDINLFRDGDVPGDEAVIWQFFERLHRRKNEVFEACITDRTRELIC